MGSLIEARHKLAGKKYTFTHKKGRSKHSAGQMVDQAISKYGNMAKGVANNFTNQNLADKVNKFAKVATDTFSNVKDKVTDLSRSAKDYMYNSIYKRLPRAHGGKVKKSSKS